MNDPLLVSSVRETLADGGMEALKEVVGAEHAADVAGLLRDATAAEAWRILDLLPMSRQAEVFGYLEPEAQVALAQAVPRRRLAAVVSEMEADERADLFNRLTPEQQDALLPALAQAEREDIRRLSAYAEGTAGAVMTSEYATLAVNLTAGQALDKLRREAPDKETIYEAYVIDADRRLLGTVSLRDLILAAPGTAVGQLMDSDPAFARVEDDRQEAARLIAKYDLLALPILNGGDKLVGIVTHDDAMDVAEEEATEDFHRSATVAPMLGNVREAGLGLLYRKRIVWLVLLVFGNLLSGAGIAYFEDTIAAYVALVFFLPLLVGSGGNAGSQSATLMVRALATGNVVLKDWARMLGRELLVAAGLGLTMATAVSVIGILRGGPEVALVVAAAMLLIVLVGSLIGVSLPFLLSRLRLDPATASAPLITTLADAVGVVVYFAFATVILELPGR